MSEFTPALINLTVGVNSQICEKRPFRLKALPGLESSDHIFAPTQPRRYELSQWLAKLQPSTEPEAQEVTSHPPLSSYREGDRIWFFHPHSKEKWIQGIVETVTQSLLRVKGKFFGRMIECADLIAPGDWELIT